MVKRRFLHVRTLSTNPEAAHVGCHLAKRGMVQPGGLRICVCVSSVAIAASDPDPDDGGLFIVNWRRCNIGAVCAFALIFHINDAYSNNERSYHLLLNSYSWAVMSV